MDAEHAPCCRHCATLKSEIVTEVRGLLSDFLVHVENLLRPSVSKLETPISAAASMPQVCSQATVSSIVSKTFSQSAIGDKRDELTALQRPPLFVAQPPPNNCLSKRKRCKPTPSSARNCASAISGISAANEFHTVCQQSFVDSVVNGVCADAVFTGGGDAKVDNDSTDERLALALKMERVDDDDSGSMLIVEENGTDAAAAEDGSPALVDSAEESSTFEHSALSENFEATVQTGSPRLLADELLKKYRSAQVQPKMKHDRKQQRPRVAVAWNNTASSTEEDADIMSPQDASATLSAVVVNYDDVRFPEGVFEVPSSMVDIASAAIRNYSSVANRRRTHVSFGVRLAKMLFSREELKSSNIKGTNDKAQLDPVRMNSIRKAAIEEFRWTDPLEQDTKLKDMSLGIAACGRKMRFEERERLRAETGEIRIPYKRAQHRLAARDAPFALGREDDEAAAGESFLDYDVVD